MRSRFQTGRDDKINRLVAISVGAHLHRVKIVLFTLLGLGAAALVAQQPSVSAPVPAARRQSSKSSSPGPNARRRSCSSATSFGLSDRPPADPAVVPRGRQIFSANCSFCHGSDARGGEGGPNLIRSEMVLNDNNGELIAPWCRTGGRTKACQSLISRQKRLPALRFLHSVPVGGRAATTGTVDPLVGDAKAGEAYFNGPGKCTTCHSVSGDLAGIGAKYPDGGPCKAQCFPGRPSGEFSAAPWKTVTVTLRTGQTVEGKLDQIDDFIVSLTDADGNYHSYPRQGDSPKVVVKDPLQPHLDMLRTFKDDDIHNLTAYLVTLK